MMVLPCGEAHPEAKLTESDVRAIRALWSDPAHPSCRQIAAQFGVSGPMIHHIVTGKNWKHVHSPTPGASV